MRFLDPGTRRVLLAEFLGLLVPQGGLKRLVLLTRQQLNDPWLHGALSRITNVG
jgi:hypothetical protein